MPLWGSVDQSNNSPIFSGAKVMKTPNTANRDALFDNTTPAAFVGKIGTGVFGVSATEQANNVANHSKEQGAHAGWNFRTIGTGPVISLSTSGTATGYSNTDVGTVASPVAGGNATFSISTNSTGGALSLTLTNAGFGFNNTSYTATIANSTGGATLGTGATVTATIGGRAGRVQTETLVAMGSISSDATTDNTQYPGT